MTNSGNPSEAAPKVAVHLLDTSIGRPIQRWEFEGKPLVSIGRAEDRDVQIGDPYVSRMHAEIRYADGQWTLVSLGKAGVVVHGHSINEFVMRGETTFRLGADGPTLRFSPVTAKPDNRSTMFFDATIQENIFDLDKSRLDRDVSDVTENDYFQELQKRARQLRKGQE